MKPRVSIIIPCYKSEKYIRCCLDSILAQTFTDWESIVVDDNPSNEMLYTISEYSKDSRIRYYSHCKKTTPACARNRGICYSTGRYIAFLDADDWWTANKLDIVMDAFKKYPYVMWVSHYLVQHYPTYEKHEEVYPGHDTAIGGTGVVVIDRLLIERILKERGYVFDETLDRMDDAELILHIRNYSSHLVPLHLSYMRMREEGLTSNTGVWERTKIITNIGMKNRAYGLVAFHLALFVFLSLGIDPLKVKKAVLG